jgi:hypothetical protein
MGWIPCSGRSHNSKEKTKTKKKIEQQEKKPLDRIKPTSGIVFKVDVFVCVCVSMYTQLSRKSMTC